MVRKAAGIEFPGWDPTTSSLIAQVEMTEEPELGIRRTPSAHALGKVEYLIKDGEGGLPARKDRRGHADRVRGRHERAHPGRAQRGPHRRLRDRLRDPQSHLHLQVQRHHTAGRGVPSGTRPAGRRRGPRASPGRWAGAQHRSAGCGESGLEAGPGVVNRTAPESLLDSYHAERHPVAARVLRTTMAQVALMRVEDRHRCVARNLVRAAELGRAPPATRRGAVRPGYSLRPRRGHPLRGAACPISTSSPPAARCESSPCCTMRGRCSSTSVSLVPSTSRRGRIAFS